MRRCRWCRSTLRKLLVGQVSCYRAKFGISSKYVGLRKKEITLNKIFFRASLLILRLLAPIFRRINAKCASETAKLRKAAKDAIMSGDTEAATEYASALLKENDKVGPNWDYGNNIHEANQILGLAALQEGRVADAKRYLIAAGKTPGSPQLNSFGPHMVLAQKLLTKGEKKVVIQYLDLAAKFWAHTSEADLKRYDKMKPDLATAFKNNKEICQKRIDDWKRQIRAGEEPKLNCSDILR